MIVALIFVLIWLFVAKFAEDYLGVKGHPRSIAEVKAIKLRRLIDYLERRTPYDKEELYIKLRKLTLKQLHILCEGIVE